MKVTFDSNAWEKIFDRSSTKYKNLQTAMIENALRGFMVEACIQIETITKYDRPQYFSNPHTDFKIGLAAAEGKDFLKMSWGPDDKRHPGLPTVMQPKFQMALDHGVKILRSGCWIGLPSPSELGQHLFEEIDRSSRETLHHLVFDSITKRGVGHYMFSANGGWAGKIPSATSKKFAKACAEWADAEMVSAHVAYGNHVICTNDFGKAAGHSVLDVNNREWLSEEYCVKILTLEELSHLY
jgi:hypothetical protein